MGARSAHVIEADKVSGARRQGTSIGCARVAACGPARGKSSGGRPGRSKPPTTLDREVGDLIGPAVQAATVAWASVGSDVESVRSPLPPFPTMAPELAAGACALDAAIHAWDIAAATGQPSPLTVALVEQLGPAARATVEPLRGFGYAPTLPEQPGDDAIAGLLRYLGRGPRWAGHI